MTSRSVAEARIELPQPRLERSAGLRARSAPQTDETRCIQPTTAKPGITLLAARRVACALVLRTTRCGLGGPRSGALLARPAAGKERGPPSPQHSANSQHPRLSRRPQPNRGSPCLRRGRGGLSVDSVDDPLRTRRSALRGALLAWLGSWEGARASEPAAFRKQTRPRFIQPPAAKPGITVLAERLGGLSVDSVDDPLRTRRSALRGALFARHRRLLGKERGTPSPQHAANRRHPASSSRPSQTGDHRACAKAGGLER